jgi:hypothetical protein
MVEKVLSPVLYHLRDRKRSQVLHHDRFKPCRDREVPLWLRRMHHQLLAGKPLGNTGGNRGRSSPDDDDHLRDLRHLFSCTAFALAPAPPAPVSPTRKHTGREISHPAHLSDYV